MNGRPTGRRSARLSDKFTRAVLDLPSRPLLFHSGLAHAAQHLGEVGPSRQIRMRLFSISGPIPTGPHISRVRGQRLRSDRRHRRLREGDRRSIRPTRSPTTISCMRSFARASPPRPWPHAEGSPSNPDSFDYELGNAFHAMGKVDEAVAAYRKSIELKPDLAAAHFYLGFALRDTGKLDEAIAAYRKSIELSPNAAETYQSRLALRDKKNIDEAISASPEGDRAETGHLRGPRRPRHTFLERGKLDDAVASLKKALELKPAAALLHCNLGVALREKGHVDEAIAEHRKAIELDPKEAEAYVGLGDVLCDKKHEYDAGIGAYEKAIELRPDHRRAFHNLSIALERKGDVDTTIAVSRRMIERQTRSSRCCLLLQLGLTLDKKGDLAAASRIWRKMIELRPNDRWLARTSACCCQEGRPRGRPCGASQGDRDRSELRGGLIAPWRSRSSTRETSTPRSRSGGSSSSSGPTTPGPSREHRDRLRGPGGSSWPWRPSARTRARVGQARRRYPSAEWLAEIEGRRARGGRAARVRRPRLRQPEDRGKAADMLDGPARRGWRQDMDRRRRLEAVGPSLGSLVREEPWVAAPGPGARRRSFRTPSASAGARSSPRVDDLVRRIRRREVTVPDYGVKRTRGCVPRRGGPVHARPGGSRMRRESVGRPGGAETLRSPARRGPRAGRRVQRPRARSLERRRARGPLRPRRGRRPSPPSARTSRSASSGAGVRPSSISRKIAGSIDRSR